MQKLRVKKLISLVALSDWHKKKISDDKENVWKKLQLLWSKLKNSLFLTIKCIIKYRLIIQLYHLFVSK